MKIPCSIPREIELFTINKQASVTFFIYFISTRTLSFVRSTHQRVLQQIKKQKLLKQTKVRISANMPKRTPLKLAQKLEQRFVNG